MTPADRRTLVVAGTLFAIVAAFVAARFELSTDILAFLPSGEDREAAELSRRIASSELTRTMVVTLGPRERADEAAAEEGGGALSTAVLAAASRALEEQLLADPAAAERVAFVEGGPPRGVEEAMWELYHPRRLGFVARTPERAAEMTSEDGLADAARELRRRLESPMSTLVARVAPGDPLLALPRLFERLEGARGGTLSIADGRFVTADGRYAVLFVGTRDSAFDSRAQEPVVDALYRAFASVRADIGPELDIDVGGVSRFALSAERAIKADIRRVSIVSTVGLGLLLVVLFRSLRLVLVAAIPVGTGVIAGAAATLLVYGRIHGVTLAFGASLIGVSIDYVVHLYCHHATSHGGARQSVRRIWSALRTGALTTIVGFVALSWSRFPGLREVALFSVCGVATAVAMTRWVLPLLLPSAPPRVAVREALVGALLRTLAWLRRRRGPVAAASLLATVAAGFGVTGVRWSEDMSDMTRLDPELVAEDDRVRGRVLALEQTRFVVAIGADDEAALQANDRVAAELRAAVDAGELAGFRSVADLLPSALAQSGVSAVLLNDDGLGSRFSSVFEAEGFRPVAFAEFTDALWEPPPEPLRYDDLRASPLAPLVRPFHIELGDRVGFVTFLQHVEDPDAIAARIDRVDGAVWVDQGALMRAANRGYQRGTAQALAVGLGAVLVVLLLRYRDPRRALAAFVPSIVAALATIAVLAAAGVGIDLVGLTALLMVVSMGVDYGVFLVDADEMGDGELGAALLSIFVACMTTVFGFGTLSLSAHPVLHQIGLTAAVGVLSCFVMAPATLVLFSGRTR